MPRPDAPAESEAVAPDMSLQRAARERDAQRFVGARACRRSPLSSLPDGGWERSSVLPPGKTSRPKTSGPKTSGPKTSGPMRWPNQSAGSCEGTGGTLPARALRHRSHNALQGNGDKVIRVACHIGETLVMASDGIRATKTVSRGHRALD